MFLSLGLLFGEAGLDFFFSFLSLSLSKDWSSLSPVLPGAGVCLGCSTPFAGVLLLPFAGLGRDGAEAPVGLGAVLG